MALSPDEIARVRALRGGGVAASQAFEEGAAPLVLRALERPVASAIVAERAPVYVTILYGMLLLRRTHELEPLHEDVERAVGCALDAALRESGAGAPRDDQAFARDLDQLVAWGCLDRRAEPLKIRGYKDVSRERFRYKLTDDAVALLDWLEGRLEAIARGRADDSRDLLIDVLGYLKELGRLVARWHDGERDADAPRRAMHLATIVDERVRAIGDELLTFRAAMLAFAARPYDVAALRAILIWLERYVSVYLARVETLRRDIAARLDELLQPRFRRALADQYAALERERSETPDVFRGAVALRAPEDVADGLRPFFAERGRLVELCARIDDSARAVLRKMHRHLRELERRSARLEDVRARIDEIKRLPPDDVDPRLATFVNALVASAHARFGSRSAFVAERMPPPLPRRSASSAIERASRPPLRPKAHAPDAVRELRARRLDDLRRWIERELLAGRSHVRLADAKLAFADAPRRWLDVARARHLDRGRDLARLGVAIDDEEGEARLGDDAIGLSAPDCTVRLARRGTAT